MTLFKRIFEFASVSIYASSGRLFFVYRGARSRITSHLGTWGYFRRARAAIDATDAIYIYQILIWPLPRGPSWSAELGAEVLELELLGSAVYLSTNADYSRRRRFVARSERRLTPRPCPGSEPTAPAPPAAPRRNRGCAAHSPAAGRVSRVGRKRP